MGEKGETGEKGKTAEKIKVPYYYPFSLFAFSPFDAVFSANSVVPYFLPFFIKVDSAEFFGTILAGKGGKRQKRKKGKGEKGKWRKGQQGKNHLQSRSFIGNPQSPIPNPPRRGRASS
jgi:hypothetical protein